VSGLLLLAIVCIVSFSVYQQAKRDKTWSWQQFGRTMVGALVLCAFLFPWALIVTHRFGDTQPLLALLLIAGPLVIGIYVMMRALEAGRPGKP
jgi:drug/metabolite transporter (DMT)-like permease